MTGKTGRKPHRLTIEEKKEVIRLRVSGRSIRDIARQIGRSPDAVTDVLKDHPVNLQALTTEALEEAQQDFNKLIDPKWLSSVASRQVSRILAQADTLQTRIDVCLSEGDTHQFSQQARAINSLSSGLNTLLKTYATVLPVQREETTETELPQLVFRQMTETEERIIRLKQERELADLQGSKASA